MRKWIGLSCGVFLEAFVFLACGASDEPEAPLLGDCLHDCGSPPLVGGGASVPDASASNADANDDVNTTPDVLDTVDVGVQGNDVFGDAIAAVDVGVPTPETGP